MLKTKLDEAGDFVIVSKGEIVSTHKTQRIAERAACKVTRNDRTRVAVFKLVSESMPKCSAEIVRK